MWKKLAVVVLIVMATGVEGRGRRTAVDRTIQPEEGGTDVVVATIDLLKQLEIFSDSSRLLRRIAYAETRDGVDFRTYRPGYDGGIWQVDEPIFRQTQNLSLYPTLTPIVERIQLVTGINWLTLSWNELRRPFFSGTAASLFLAAVIPEEIPGPGNVAEQAELWKAFYNSDPQDTEQNFIEAVDEFENEECPVRGLDLVFIFDSSGSVGRFNFSVEKEFAVNITNAFSIGPNATRVGAVAFSGLTYHQISLDSLDTNDAVREGLLEIPYNDIKIDQFSTNTSGALITVRSSLFMESAGARPAQFAFPRVVILITDGRSNVDRNLTIPAAKALHSDSVIVLAVGIGRRRIRFRELKEVASQPELASLIDGFDVTELQGLQRVLSDEACRAPAAVEVREEVRVSAQRRGAVSYFQYQLPEEGMTLQLNVAAGRVVLYASMRIQNPNSALYDYTLETGSEEDIYISPEDLMIDNSEIAVNVVERNNRKRDVGEEENEGEEIMIFITVEGLELNNSYTLDTLVGDTTSSSSETSASVIHLLLLLNTFSCVLLQ